jgi:hypothetical protein
MRTERTDLETAATVAAIGDLGHGPRGIAQTLDVPKSTAHDGLRGSHGWGDLKDTSAFKQRRAEIKQALQAASLEIARQALAQIERKLPDASARDAAIVYGVMRDRERLDAGEPTEHIAVLSRHELIGLDQLAQRLSVELVRRSHEAIIALDGKSAGGV